MKPEKGNLNKNNKDSGGNKKNLMGLVSMICWAIFFTLMIKSCSSSYSNANVIEVPYTTFKEWVQQDLIAEVNIEGGEYSIILKEGVEIQLPEPEEPGYAQELLNSLVPMTPGREVEPEYITVPLYGVEDDQLMDELMEKGIVAYTNTVDSSTYILSFLLTSILPIVIMVLLMKTL